MQIFQEFWNEKQKAENLITSIFLSGGRNSRQLLFRVLASISAACRWKHETENGYLQVPIESLTAIFFIIFVHILVLCKPVIATGKADLYTQFHSFSVNTFEQHFVMKKESMATGFEPRSD